MALTRFRSRKGSYSSRKDIVYIVNFTNKLSVFTSKQRPRKMSIKGSDGVGYQFLLKGTFILATTELV